MFARKHMLRWLTTPYRQPDPLPNSAKICPIKPNHFSTEPLSNDRLTEALRTKEPAVDDQGPVIPTRTITPPLAECGVGRGGTRRTGYGIKGHARSHPARVRIPP